MNKAEREELIRKNTADRDAILRDMAERRQQRHGRQLRGEEPFDVNDDPQPQRVPPTVLNQGERQVREHHERQRPVLDDAAMELWNAWMDARCTAIIDAKLAMMADIIGDESGHNERRLRDDVLNMRGSMVRQLRSDMVKKFTVDMNTMRDDVLAVLRGDLGIVESDNVIDLPNPIRRKA